MDILNSMASRLKRILSTILGMNESLDAIKMNQGVILSLAISNMQSKNIQDFEFKIFSQWGEDGILQHLSQVVDIRNKTFIEFGVEDFLEANCRFLLMKDNWSGFVIDGSSDNIHKLKQSYFYWRHDLQAISAYITRENINELLAQSGFAQDLGILSIDLDGIDYYVLEAIDAFRPRILVCEYNAIFGQTRKVTVPYDSGFRRTKAHHSNLYFGASLSAITHLAEKKGYSLVGTNSAGNNAFYVRHDLITEKVKAMSVDEAFTPSKFRESRDQHYNLTYATGAERLKLLKGLMVYNVETNLREPL